MGIRGWSRDHERCQGWDDAEGHHACTSPTLPHAGGGRCTRCYAMHRNAAGLNRDFFPSVNDEVFPGDPRPVAVVVKEPVMVNGQRDTPKIDRDVVTSLGRFASEAGDQAVIAPDPVKAPRVAVKTDAPNFEVFTIIGGTPKEVGPSLTIRRDGRLSINKAALDALGAPVFIELLYDRERRILGIRKSSSTVPHAKMIGQEKSAPGRGYIGLKALLVHYGVVGARAAQGETKQYGDVLAVQLTLPEQAKGR